MRLTFIGPPGAGKGTQCARLARELGVPHLSSGEMLRQAVRQNTNVGRLSEDYLRQGLLVPDPLILEIIGKRVEEEDCRGGYLLDGFPRTEGQAVALDEFLRERQEPLDAALELVVPQAELLRRLAARGRDDDQQEVIRQRLVAYDEQTSPLVQYYRERGVLRTIDGVGDLDAVYERILRSVRRVARP